MKTPIVTLDKRWTAKAWEYGRDTILGYSSGDKSRQESFRGVEFNMRCQAEAKMAEIAVAIWAGQNPSTSISFQTSRPDAGIDVEAFGRLIDVKLVGPHASCLAPSPNLERKLATVQFDTFVLVRGAAPTFELVGWIPLAAFIEVSTIADGKNDERFLPGTRFLHQSRLHPMIDMVPAEMRGHYCECGFYAGLQFKDIRGRYFCSKCTPKTRSPAISAETAGLP